MKYHIDTGLIYEKFNNKCNCPLCEIQNKVEEQLLFEFLNDAVMDEGERLKVNDKGFCEKHTKMLFSRPNKLSLSLQLSTHIGQTLKTFDNVDNVKKAKKQAEILDSKEKSCIICDYLEKSMIKYYKTVAEMFTGEKDFYSVLLSTNGFCMHHYTELLRYSKYAGFSAKAYVKILSGLQKRSVMRIRENLEVFCDHHDYRNADKPLGSAENALPDAIKKLFGDKQN